MRILMVPPRYGMEIVGGAETHLGALAQRAQRMGADVEIATTCATDNEHWANSLSAGESHEDGLRVYRFPVSPRDARRHRELQHRLARQGTLDPLDEADLFATSAWSDELQRFLDDEGLGYDAIVFAPYLLGTTYWGAQSHPSRTIVMPCLHDEPQAYLPSVHRLLRSVRSLMFNSPAEEKLIRQIMGPVAGSVVGMGFDLPETPAPSAPPSLEGVDRYVIYVGRLEEGKRVHVAAQAVAHFAQRYDPSLKLVCIGRGSWRPRPEVAPYVHMAGFLSEADKRSAISGAIALINPSELESLSIVVLEAFMEETPVLVAAGSAVMADHCESSGGGFTFADQEEFDLRLRQLITDPGLRVTTGRRGRDYVAREYSWPVVEQRLQNALAVQTPDYPVEVPD